MKTTYHSRNSRGRNRAIFISVIVALLAALLILTSLFSRMFYKGMTVLSGSAAGAGQAASSFSSLFSSKAGLERENADLRREIAEKDVMLADRDILVKENADLKASIHYKTETGNILARAVSKPPFTPFDVIVVDAGEARGVKEGDRVMIGQTYVGNVTLVSSNSSHVTLLSAPGSKTEAFVGDDALPVILSGKGGGNFETTLPQGSSVSEGDLIFAYYLQTPYLVGKVSRVIENEDNTFMTILLALPINLYSLSNVEIIST